MSDLDRLRDHVADKAREKGVSEDHALRRFKAFDRYRAEASEKSGLPVDHDTVRSYASLKLTLDSIVEQQLIGKQIDSGEHLRIIEALRDLLPQKATTPTIKLEIVEATDGPLVPHCRRCGWEPGMDTHNPPRKPLPAVSENERTSDVLNGFKPAPAAEVAPPIEREHRPGIHNAVLPDGATARQEKISDDWKRHVAADSYGSVGGIGPNFPTVW
jgi:hypothetical protein